MRDLTYYVAVSLDGRISGPGDDFSAFLAEGDHLAMIASDYPESLPAAARHALGLTDVRRFDTVLMGWNTYALGLPLGVDDPYPHLEQIVVTRAHADHPVPESVRLTDDPVAEVRRLKQAEDDADGKGIWLCGGGLLATALAAEIDRLVLKVNPVVLGAGPALFAEGAYVPRAFKRTAVTAYDSGVVVTEHARR